MEGDPTIRLTINDTEFIATPDNSSLFRFAGNLAMYDHVFLMTNEEEATGTYIFNQNESYELIEGIMIENEFPIHDNLRGVAECDQRAFDKFIDQQLTDVSDYPPEWQE